jgi:hypothetical protein
MTSAHRRDANRRNARASTGPRTAAGKARSARNALRHGLSVSACGDPSWSEEIEALARAIAGTGADAERLELACRIAEAQTDVIRARAARRQLYPEVLREPTALARLAAIDRYEGRALSRRKRAIRELADARCEEGSGGHGGPGDPGDPGDPGGALAERSQSRPAEPSACVATGTPQGADRSQSERGGSSDASSSNLAERSQTAIWPNEAKPQKCNGCWQSLARPPRQLDATAWDARRAWRAAGILAKRSHGVMPRLPFPASEASLQ